MELLVDYQFMLALRYEQCTPDWRAIVGQQEHAQTDRARVPQLQLGSSGEAAKWFESM